MNVGNHIEIRNGKNELVAEANLGLVSGIYFEKVAKKYDRNYTMLPIGKTIEQINKEINDLFNKATEEDKVIFKIFIFDEAKLTEDDILYLEKAIGNYPEEFHENPKMILEKYLHLLKEYKELNTQYKNTTVETTIKRRF